MLYSKILQCWVQCYVNGYNKSVANQRILSSQVLRAFFVYIFLIKKLKIVADPKLYERQGYKNIAQYDKLRLGSILMNIRCDLPSFQLLKGPETLK